jgi:hypothetical protein
MSYGKYLPMSLDVMELKKTLTSRFPQIVFAKEMEISL